MPPGRRPAIDYLAGELSSNPRWIMVSPLTKQEMLRARVDVRQVLGIAPNAPSQFVVETLLQFAWLWQAGNQPAAMQALAAPGFTLPPQQTLQVLTNLPYVRSANIASIDAATQMLRRCDKVEKKGFSTENTEDHRDLHRGRKRRFARSAFLFLLCGAPRASVFSV